MFTNNVSMAAEYVCSWTSQNVLLRDVIPCDMVTFCDKTCLPEIL